MKTISSSNVWLEFNGHKNTEYGVQMVSMPTRPHPKRLGDAKNVPGRNGKLFLDQEAYDQMIVTVRLCTTKDNIDEVNGWLTGSGSLRFGDDPNHCYTAMVTKEYSVTNKSNRLIGKEFTVSFDCYPFRYVYPSPDVIQLSVSGSTVENTGTVFSQPEIKINSTGSFTLIVNGYQIDGNEALTSGVIVDCELMECFSTDKTESYNSLITMDEYPRLDAGVNIITWTGSITSIEITPRWRDL